MNKHYLAGVVVFGGLVLVAALALGVPAQASAPAVPVAATPFPNCRYGVAAGGDQMLAFDIVSNLNTGWYLDFGVHQTPPGPPRAEFTQLIDVKQGPGARGGGDVCGPSYTYTVTPPLSDTAGGLGTLVAANPGALWIVGNEPDRKTIQGDICPQQYAQAYHDVYSFIKSRDPSAQIAIAGLVEVSPGRVQYLDIVWDTYLAKYGAAMPVDVWTMHIYILAETSEGDAHIALGTDPALAIRLCDFSHPVQPCVRYADHDNLDIFKEQVVRMRDWMKRHGQQNKPLLLSEYSLLLPYNYYGTCSAEVCPPEGLPGCFCDETKRTFHPKRVANFITNTFSYLGTATDPALGYSADGYRLVQQWLWYRLQTDGLAHASNLMYPDTYTFTLQGKTWHDYVAGISAGNNLIPAQVPSVAKSALNGSAPVTVALSAEVRDNGNVALTGTVTVTFYSGDPGSTTLPIGSATFSGLGGCARRAAVVTTTWSNLSTGLHPFWVKVDSTNTIAETDETDNVAQGVVLVNPRQIYLPVVLR